MKRFAILIMIVLSMSRPVYAAEKPNIVVLLADDHSAADMSVYGAIDIPTPHLDSMASRGMVFDRAFVNSPSCAPSRAALFTGLFPAKNGAESNHSKSHESIKRLPAYLKELGYECVSFCKVSHYAHVTEQGFDRAENYGYHDHAGVQASVEFLKNRKSDKPLALFFGTNWPHVPLPEPESVDPTKVHIQPMHIDTPEFRHYRARYINATMKMDEEIGTVYDAALRYLGAENTFFLQTSDHGAQLPFGKWNLYDEGTRVPLIVHWQGHVMPGTRTAAMAQWIDILPTLIEVGGGKNEPLLDGRSLLSVLEGRASKHRDAIFTTHSNDNNMNVYPIRSMRTDRWKYIRNLHPEFRFTSHIDRSAGEASLVYFSSWEEAAKNDPRAAAILKRYRERPAEELYDLESDPYELNNIAAVSENSRQLLLMRNGLDEWMTSTDDKQSIDAKPLLLSEPFLLIQPAGKKKAALILKADDDLHGDAAPRIANRPFTITVELEKLGEGVLAAQGGQANGWALFVRDGELHFVVNRDKQRESLTAKINSAKRIEASLGPKSVARLKIDGEEVSKKSFSGLLTVQPIDGLQIGRDLAAAVGDYKAPYVFKGEIKSATLEVGAEIPQPPFVGSVPSGGKIPAMKVTEQAKHPLP